MPAHSPVTPINWRSLVAEAVRRRKGERMTQKEHAALASVSIPTIVAFDRGERTLSLAKAFDILRVVGLVEEPVEDGAQEAFVQAAFVRWRELTAKLPKDSPGRFPHGWYRIDYALEGELRPIELHELQSVIAREELRNTGWPMFVSLTRDDLAPYEHDGGLECWVKPEDAGVERVITADPAHCDFWRAAPTGRFMLIRGYQEDAQETFKPRTILDTTLPIWRVSEGLLHAAGMAAALKDDAKSDIVVRFRILYTGLSGRVLRPWANPLADLLVEGGAARSDETLLETVASTKDIEANLAAHVTPLIASLYERFGVSGLSTQQVAGEVERFRKSRT